MAKDNLSEVLSEKEAREMRQKQEEFWDDVKKEAKEKPVSDKQFKKISEDYANNVEID